METLSVPPLRVTERLSDIILENCLEQSLIHSKQQVCFILILDDGDAVIPQVKVFKVTTETLGEMKEHYSCI